jgi:hypothetical protein
MWFATFVDEAVTGLGAARRTLSEYRRRAPPKLIDGQWRIQSLDVGRRAIFH